MTATATAPTGLASYDKVVSVGYVVAWSGVTASKHMYWGRGIWVGDWKEARQYGTYQEAVDAVRAQGFGDVSILDTRLLGALHAPKEPTADELTQLATFRRNAVAAAKREAEAWFAEQVLEYHAGCDDGKYQFLEEIGLDEYCQREQSYRFNITFEGTPASIEEALNDVIGAIEGWATVDDYYAT